MQFRAFRLPPRYLGSLQLQLAQLELSQITVQTFLLEKRLDLAINQIGSLDLPGNRQLKVRPMDIGERGVLLAVEVEGSLDSDLRVPNHHLVVFGTEAYEGGKLVISLEPSW